MCQLAKFVENKRQEIVIYLGSLERNPKAKKSSIWSYCDWPKNDDGMAIKVFQSARVDKAYSTYPCFTSLQRTDNMNIRIWRGLT